MTGGAPYPYTASTEVLVAGEEAWREAGPLPSPRYGLRVASLGTSLLATGGVQDVMPGECSNMFHGRRVRWPRLPGLCPAVRPRHPDLGSGVSTATVSGVCIT